MDKSEEYNGQDAQDEQVPVAEPTNESPVEVSHAEVCAEEASILDVSASESDMPNQLASRWKRLGGVMLDALIGMLLMLPIMFLFMGIGVLSLDLANQVGQQLVMSLMGIGVFLLLNGYLLVKHGQTIGKRIVGTRIVDLQGELCPFTKMYCFRYLIPQLIIQVPFIGQLFALVNACFIFGKAKRCLHDYMAGTQVINA